MAVFLSDLDPIAAVNGWGPYERDRSNGETAAGDGGILSLNGITYSKGLGVHANSRLTYSLGGSYSRFQSDIGIDDSRGGAGSVVFVVVADGDVIFRSGTFTGSTATESIDLDVSGVETLELIVENANGSINNDHANWADARLISAASSNEEYSIEDVTDFLVSESAGFAQISVFRTGDALTRETLEYVVNPAGTNSATPGVDYLSPTLNGREDTGLAVFEVGENEALINIPIVDDDLREDVESFSVAIQNNSSGSLSFPRTALINIVDNEGEPRLSFITPRLEVQEGDGTFEVKVIRSGPNTEALSVGFSTSDGSAIAGIDYESAAGTITFGPRETEQSITLGIIDDGRSETSESFSLSLGNPDVFLSDLDPIAAVNGWGPYERDRSNGETAAGDGGILSLNGITYSKGLGVHANSRLTYSLGGSYNRFQSDIGIDDSRGGAGSVVFVVVADGDVIFRSGTFTGSTATESIDLDVSGVETLELIVENANGSINNDHANWADARLIASDVSASSAVITINDNDASELSDLIRSEFASVSRGFGPPTTIDWSPDGRYVFVAHQTGFVTLIDNVTSRRNQVVLNITDEVNFSGDRGLIGLAVHPDFFNQPYIYLGFTYDPPQTASLSGLAGRNGAGNRPSRVIRYEVDLDTLVADPSSARIILGSNSTAQFTNLGVNSTGDFFEPAAGVFSAGSLPSGVAFDEGFQDNDPRQPGIQNFNLNDYLATDSLSHSIGNIRFGPDGYLYITNGDGTSFQGVDPRGVRVQDIENLSGKMLRLDPLNDYKGVAGNPFFDESDPNGNSSKVFYYGLRNPFRFTFDSLTGLPVIGDVGSSSWEEVNTGPAGSNFGWPFYEGPAPQNGFRGLPQAQACYANGDVNPGSPDTTPAVAPLLSRSHLSPENATAIVQGDFYDDNTFIFGDVRNGEVFSATLDSNRSVETVTLFDTLPPGLVDLRKGPDDLLYAVVIATNTIYRWTPAQDPSQLIG